jgi:carbamoyl-phosphate synthase large subunit
MPSLIASSLSANFLALEAELGLPFIVKPRQGFGSRGIRIIETENDFAAIKSQMGDFLMAQRLIGSSEDEYTIAVFGDGNGDIATEIALRRTLSLEGFTEKAEVVFDHPFSSILSLLCSFFKPTGPTNFQFRLHEREPKLLEINPRLSSSTSIRTAFGYNESLMAVDFKLNGLLPFQPNIKGGKAVRYAEEKIFYE